MCCVCEPPEAPRGGARHGPGNSCARGRMQGGEEVMLGCSTQDLQTVGQLLTIPHCQKAPGIAFREAVGSWSLPSPPHSGGSSAE